MLKSYEAIFENGQMTWTLDQSMIESARVIVTIVEDRAPRLPKRRTASPVIAGLGKTINNTQTEARTS